MINKAFKPLLLILVTFIPTLSYADVESISSDIYAQYGNDAYWEAKVTCTDTDQARVIQHNADWSGQWCGKAITSVCAAEKNDVAEKVCSSSYTSELVQVQQEEKEKQAEIDRQKAEEQRIADQKRQQQRIANQQKKIAETQSQQGLVDDILLEEQKIAIELEKLELRKKELQLESRATEIEELLNDQ